MTNTVCEHTEVTQPLAVPANDGGFLKSVARLFTRRRTRKNALAAAGRERVRVTREGAEKLKKMMDPSSPFGKRRRHTAR